MLHPLWSDILRYLAFGQAGIVLVLTSVIIARYSFKLSITKAHDRALPWHIVLIGISYVGLTLFVLVELRNRFGEAMTWRTPLALFLFACGDAAFIFMIMHLSVQRLIVAAVVDKIAIKLEHDLEQLKRAAVVTAENAAAAAETVQQTHVTVSEIKKIVENGPV